MNLVYNSAATDKDGFYSDKKVYVAIIAKIKAQLYGEPETFAKFELMKHYCKRARKDCWDDMRIVAESNKLEATLESTLPNNLIQLMLVRRRLSQQLCLNGSKKRHSIYNETRCSILDFLNDIKGAGTTEILDFPLAILGNPAMRYNAFIKLMEEYLEDKIVYRIFLRRGLDLCDGVTNNVSLQIQFLGQFCTDIDVKSMNTTISIAPLLLSLGRVPQYKFK